MPHSTYRCPPSHLDGPSARRTRHPYGAWLMGGVVAAGLGLGVLAVAVLLLWMGTPPPGNGAGDALHVAADLWLAAHGADLVRDGRLSGGSAPVGLTPLLFTALPVWLLYRAARNTLDEDRHRYDDADDADAADGLGELGGLDEAYEAYEAAYAQDELAAETDAARLLGWVSAGYLLVGAAAVVYAAKGPLRVDVLSAAVCLPLFTLAVTACAGRCALGRMVLPAPRTLTRLLTSGRTPALVRRAATSPYLPGLLRASRAATVLLLAGGALLTVFALVCRAGAVWRAFPQLTGSWAGGAAVLLLTLALLPNAVVWGTSYALGPGFALGAGGVAGPLVTDYPPLPHFPLLAAVPGEGAGVTPLTWVVSVLPVAAGLTMGWRVARTAAPVCGRRDISQSWRGTAAVAGLAACGCGAVMAAFAGFSGGPLGDGELARFGPSWWLTGAAAFCWTGLVGAPTALVVRAWRLRHNVGPSAPAAPAASVPPAASVARARTGAGTGTGRAAVRDRGTAAAPPPQDAEWHSTASRRTRWAALKAASGGLMADFEPADRERDPWPAADDRGPRAVRSRRRRPRSTPYDRA